MKKYPFTKIAIVVFAIALGAGFSTGCSSMEPTDYHDEAEDGMSGPGLITGEEGEKVIFRVPADPKDQPEETNTSGTPEETPKSE